MGICDSKLVIGGLGGEFQVRTPN